MLAREAAVVASDLIGTHQIRQAGREPLGELSRIDENERGAVLIDELHDLAINLVPLLVRTDGGERGRRHFDRDIHCAPMPYVDHAAFAASANQKMCDF